MKFWILMLIGEMFVVFSLYLFVSRVVLNKQRSSMKKDIGNSQNKSWPKRLRIPNPRTRSQILSDLLWLMAEIALSASSKIVFDFYYSPAHSIKDFTSVLMWAELESSWSHNSGFGIWVYNLIEIGLRETDLLFFYFSCLTVLIFSDDLILR
jgi:hypothetical protein